MGKVSALIVSGMLLWPSAGWLGYMVVSAILNSSDKLQGNLFIFAIITLTCCAVMAILPILAFMFTGAVASAPASSTSKDDDLDAYADEFGGESDESVLQPLDGDSFDDAGTLDSEPSGEFETVEFESDEFGDFEDDSDFDAIDDFDDEDDDDLFA